MSLTCSLPQHHHLADSHLAQAHLTRHRAQNLFDEMYYSDLDGGILEAFGRLLKHNVRIYVYPALDNHTGELIAADTLKVRCMPRCR